MAGLLAEAFDGVTVIDLCDRQGDFGAFSFTEKDVCLVDVYKRQESHPNGTM